MVDSSLALAESLLGEAGPRSAHCGRKFVTFLSLFLGLGFAVLLISEGGQHLAVQQFSSNLQAVPTTSNRAGCATSYTRRAALLSSTALLSSFGVKSAHCSEPVTACKPDANNCWSTASSGKTMMMPWTWPAGTSRDKAMTELKAVLDSYPQAGQDGVDLGGWSVAEDDGKGFTRIEFKSGIGNFAKFFNGGKPFVDDLYVSVEPSNVAIKSSSRVGDSDFGVNAKRLNYLAAALREKGWDAPGVKAG